MIPFAILQGKIEYKSGKSLEIRVLELASDYVTFRVPLNSFLKEVIDSVSFSFYIRNKNEYETVSLVDFEISMIKEEKYAQYYMLKTSDKRFEELSDILSKEYLEYVDLKINYSDSFMTRVMTGGKYPENEEEYLMDRGEGLAKSWISEAWLISKRNPNQKIFVYEDSLLLGKAPVDGVVFGNAFCPARFPKIDVLLGKIEDAYVNRLEVMIEVPPVNETVLNEFMEKAEKLVSSFSNLILQFNDLGMYEWALKRFDDINTLKIEKGVLLYKSRRDPRSKYLDYSEADNLMLSEKTVFGPWYQTNTGTFCTLNALVIKGDRGKQERVIKCPKYCKNYHLSYPSHLEMVGEGNSLFGFNKDFYHHDHAERVVINI